MNARTYVLIFFAWAMLTLITPTLILLSASSKPEDSNGLLAEVVKLRRLPINVKSHNAMSLTSGSTSGGAAYGGGLGFWDLIYWVTSFGSKTNRQLRDDPWEGHAG